LIAIIIAITHNQPSPAGILDRLPSWPVTDVGEPIPDELVQLWSGGGKKGADGQPPIAKWCPGLIGHFDSFPSKAPRRPPNLTTPDDEGEDEGDQHTSCDDGDQTMYNGMLCAVGFAAGCTAVAQAQDTDGRWFRSPHRRWVWTARCKDLLDWESQGTPNKYMLYQKRCAYGFSPDHNLGVLLYVLTQKNVAAYQKWLNWLNRNSETTKLCKEGGAPTDDCWERIIWPRVCTEDIGHGKKPQKIPMLNRYGGECALRPWDALDFAAVNQALHVVPPARMSNWDVESRAMMRSGKEFAGAVVPVTRAIEGPPLLFMASFDDASKFSLHLDAVRVLIRMLIRNPSLQLINLPDLPDPSNLPGILDFASSDATDPLSIHFAARQMADRAPNNAFFRVLADGPTPKVRTLILERCPSATDTTDSGHWIWEKGPADATGAKEHSMGWDCAFVGALYNKMRVERSLLEELLDRFLMYAHPVAAMTRGASEALQTAQALNALKANALREAEQGLHDANDFIDNAYDQLRQATLNNIRDVTDDLGRLHNREIELENELASLANRAAGLPDEIVQRQVRRWCRVCRHLVRFINVPNPAKQEVLRQADSVRAQLAELRTNAISQATSIVNELNGTLAELDRKLQQARANVQNRVLDAAIEVARTELEQTEKEISDARKQVARIDRLDAQIQSRIALWRGEEPMMHAMEQPAPIDALPAKDPPAETVNSE
jgi:predicted  nucleic acid-binding Zn-ribbon protein